MRRLSELPDFLPAGEPGSPERRACAVGTFTNREANARFMSFATRLAIHASPASAPHHPTPRPSSGESPPELAANWSAK